ncbi:hypothetical protein ACGC1H_007472 [Rhizoctonia solani]
MPPNTGLPFALQPIEELDPNDRSENFWHHSLERVPELFTRFFDCSTIEMPVQRIEICLSLRQFHDTTKQLHWCLLFTNTTTIDGTTSQNYGPYFEHSEGWLADTCSGLGSKNSLLHYLNIDDLATRRLTLRTVAVLHLVSKDYTFGRMLTVIAGTPMRELLCCSIVRSTPNEPYLVGSTRMWALAWLRASPGFGFDPLIEKPDNRFRRMLYVVEKEMRLMSMTELQAVAGTPPKSPNSMRRRSGVLLCLVECNSRCHVLINSREAGFENVNHSIGP